MPRSAAALTSSRVSPARWPAPPLRLTKADSTGRRNASTVRGCDGARKRRAADRAGRPAMRSPGRPPGGATRAPTAVLGGDRPRVLQRRRRVAAGVSPAVGTRRFRAGGGMPTVSRAPLSGRSLSFAEREELAILRAQDVGVRETARQLGRSPSTVSRELCRNAATRGGRLAYRATTAQWHADQRAKRPKVAKLAANQRLRSYAQERLAGEIRRPNGIAVSGRRCGGSVGGTGVARTAGGHTHGVQSRPRTGCGSTSPMMGPCGSRMRPSTRRCTSKVVAPCAVS
jgi:hypothetical protein